MRILLKILALILALAAASGLSADDPFYTYAGGFISGGMNSISYSDWVGNETLTQDVTGYNFRAGLLAVIFVNHFAGEAGVSGSFSFNDVEETNVYSADWYGAFKYVYSFNDTFALSTGPGIYLETLPATRQYDGGGLQYSLGSWISFASDWKFGTDLFFRYGYFGIGEGSAKMNYGLQISFTRRAGNL